jgi:hypothetical protein
MRLARIGTGFVFGFLLCASLTCFSQDSTSTKASECKRSINKKDYEGWVDGPYVQDIGYSRALQSCILITAQGFPTPKRKISLTTYVVVAQTHKTAWSDTRLIPQGHAEPKDYPDLGAELKRLEIDLAPR